MFGCVFIELIDWYNQYQLLLIVQQPLLRSFLIDDDVDRKLPPRGNKFCHYGSVTKDHQVPVYLCGGVRYDHTMTHDTVRRCSNLTSYTMRGCRYINDNSVMIRLCYVVCALLQCTIKTGHAFHPLHRSVVTHHPLPPHRSRTVPAHTSTDMMMAWTTTDIDVVSSALNLPLITQTIAVATSQSQTEPWVQPLSNVLDPFLNFMSFAMLSRVVLSWYPEIVASNVDTTSGSNSDENIAGTPAPQQQQQQQPPSSPEEITKTESSEESDTVVPQLTTATTTKSEKTSLPIWITLIVIPTQPLLQAVKDIVPPAFGVDITPVFWLAIFTFIHEILLGQQGLLTMKIKYGI